MPQHLGTVNATKGILLNEPKDLQWAQAPSYVQVMFSDTDFVVRGQAFHPDP